MPRTLLALVFAVFVAACGNSAGPVDTTLPPATSTTDGPPSCPSGEQPSQGDGPDYLSLGGSFEQARAGDIPDGRPRILGVAAEAIPEELMVGLAYTGCTSLEDGARFEEMAWSNGLGLLLVSWHEWPKVADPSVMPFGGVAEQAGVVEVSRAEAGSENSRLQIIRLFDGLKVVSISSYGLTTMDMERLEEVAWAVYDSLPLDRDGASAEGATVDDVLETLALDRVSVGEAEPSAELSAFTLNLGAAHASYTAVVNGTEISIYDFGTPVVAERALRAVSPDGFSIAHMPHDWDGDPHFWRLGPVVVLYEGADEDFLTLISSALGEAAAGVITE